MNDEGDSGNQTLMIRSPPLKDVCSGDLGWLDRTVLIDIKKGLVVGEVSKLVDGVIILHRSE